MKQTQAAFTQLIQQHSRLVYKVCSIYTNTADDNSDLFQEIVLQAWAAYPKFKQQAKESTWLYRIALNTAISHKRKQKHHPTIPADDMLHLRDTENTDAYAEEYKQLQAMIAELPGLEKALILLYLEDKSYAEIADIMGISASNVGTRLGRIKDKLKKQAQPFLNQ